MTRRQLLCAAATTVVGLPVAAWVGAPRRSAEVAGKTYPLRRTDGEWHSRLTTAQYKVLRDQGTERAFSSPLDHEHRPGVFTCAGCGHPLFASSAKFDSGTGWPSFWQPLDGAVETHVDTSFFMVRTEVRCANCGSHLGHVFPDGPRPTGLRYCMNGVALRFQAA